MNKNLVPVNTQVPAFLQQLGFDTQNTEYRTAGDPVARISIRGKRFRVRIPGEDEKVCPEGTELPVIILGVDPSKGCAKVFYEKGYTPGETTPPDCSSADGVRPDAWIAEPAAERCATCPNNTWGSSKTGKGKLCSDKKRLLIIGPSKLADHEADIFALDVPPTSLKNLSTYAGECAQYKIPITAVVTTLAFDDSETPVVIFRFGQFLDEDMARVALTRIREDLPKLVAKIHRVEAGTVEDDGEPAVEEQAAATPPPAPPVEEPKKPRRGGRKPKAAETPPPPPPPEATPPAGGTGGTTKLDEALSRW